MFTSISMVDRIELCDGTREYMQSPRSTYHMTGRFIVGDIVDRRGRKTGQYRSISEASIVSMHAMGFDQYGILIDDPNSPPRVQL